MMRIMLLDDEPYMRQMLRTLGNFAQHDCEVVCEAIHGQDALAQLQKTQVDIVFTDIRMPVMDGIHFIEEAKKRYPEMHLVAVSAYNDFHLVHDAFMRGAEEYLLKSEMTGEDIATILDAIRLRMQNTKAAPKDHFEHLHAFLAYASEGNRLRASNYPLLDTLPSLQNRQVFGLSIEIPSGVQPDTSIIQAFFADRATPSACFYRDDHTVSVLILPEASMSITHITDFLQHLRSALASSHHTVVNMGVSFPRKEYASAPDALRESRIACASCFLFGQHTLQFYTKDGSTTLSEANIHRRCDMLMHMLEHPLETEFEPLQKFLPVSPTTVCVQDTEKVKELFRRYHYMLSGWRHTHAEMDPQALLLDGMRLLNAGADLKQMNAWLLKVLDLFQGHLADLDPLSKMRSYIHTHYAEDISLNTLADVFHMSPTYISRLFSQNGEDSFVDVLSKERIEQAARLMRETNDKLYTISEKVGFHSQEQFSRTFKKVLGQSPKQYAQSIHRSLG